MKKHELICIACPLGCSLEVEENYSPNQYLVSGNKCPRGEQYAIKELTNPTRMITSTVKISNSHLCRLPVRTSDAIPKGKIFECMEVLNNIQVKGPVKAGDIVVEKLMGLDVNIIATRSM